MQQVGWDGKFLYGAAFIAYALRSILQEYSVCVQTWMVFWTGQNTKENKRDCEEIAMYLLPFSSFASNIYF